eukprot:Tbor_TRINITY_DN4111_c0_g1::TRINITY_DN4111_c0_g1_i1::g.26484::m.26484
MCLSVLRNHAFGGYISNRVERKVGPNGVKGLYATAMIEEDSLLACIPSYAVICPASALVTEVGRTLHSRLKPEGYYMKNEDAELRVSRDTFLVASMTALQLQKGPLANYLREIVVERESEESIKEAFIGKETNPIQEEAYHTAVAQRVEQWKHFVSLRELSHSILEEAYADMMGAPVTTPSLSVQDSLSMGNPSASSSSPPLFTLEELHHANAICESRVVTIPSKVDVFNGPALVPWFDLINHDDQEPLVYAEVMETPDLPEKLRKISPVCVVGVAARDIQPGEHLTYYYDEPIVPSADANEKLKARLMWALRFHYVPPNLRV